MCRRAYPRVYNEYIYIYSTHIYIYIIYIHIYYIYICIFKRSHPPLSVAFANKNVRQKC